MKYNYEYMEAGKWLQDMRKSKGITARKLASEIGISANYISLLEKGERKPSVAVAESLSDFYGISRADLLHKYDVIEDKDLLKLISNPSLKKVLTKMSTDKRLTDDDISKISDKLSQLLGDDF